MSRLPPLYALRAFAVFARLRSVNAAANELCVSHSAVVHQLRSLQRWFGLDLFRRGPKGLELTDVGERYRLVVCGAFDQIAAGTQQLQYEERGSIVRVGTLHMINATWLMPNLQSFWGEHPNVRASINYIGNDQEVFADYDLVVLKGPSDKADLPGFARLFGAALVAVCSSDFLRKVGAILTPDALLRLCLIHDTTQPYDWTNWFARSGTPLTDDRQRDLWVSDGAVALASALSGQGVALLRAALIQQPLRSNLLVRLFPTAIDEDDAYHLRWDPSAKLSRSAIILRDWLIAASKTVAA